MSKSRSGLFPRIAITMVPALGFVGLLAYGLLRSAPDEIAVGSEAPNFELPLLGEDGTLGSDELAGSPVVFNFWASWCIPCREEARTLERTWRRYRAEGLVLVGVNIRDSESDALGFVEEFGVTYPVVRDEREDLARRLGVFGIPETFFIDHDWRFVGSVAGESRGEQQGTVVLGAISESVLVENVELLLRRAAGG